MTDHKHPMAARFRGFLPVIVDVETGEYAIAKQIVKDGQSTAIIGGLPSFDRAYMDALKKAFDEIKLDTTKLK